MTIHPLALVSPKANLGPDVRVGPYCIVEADTTLGEGCILENHVIIKSGTILGARNRIFEGAVLGGPPQHAHMPDNPGRVIIGSNNTIREHVTIHRALEQGHATVVGDNCLLMANSHVAHDCRLGNNVIVVNNALLAGHVVVGDRANISGAVAVHQFCRIGALAMVGGQAHIIKDVPPFMTIDGLSSYVVGLNQIGLRRAGYRAQEVQQLKAAYRVIYRSGLTWAEILKRLKAEFGEGPAAEFYRFLSTTTRGIISERRLPPGATIKIRRETEEAEPLVRIKAG